MEKTRAQSDLPVWGFFLYIYIEGEGLRGFIINFTCETVKIHMLFQYEATHSPHLLILRATVGVGRGGKGQIGWSSYTSAVVPHSRWLEG